jgi:FAD synthetase
MNQNNVLIFGTFDILHPGHLKLIEFAKKLGSVNVALTPDELCLKYKGVNPVNNYNLRKKRLENISFVKEVVKADKQPNSYNIIQKIKPDIIVLGYDQIGLKSTIQNRLKEFNSTARIIIANPYRADIYKSSKLRNTIVKIA